MAQDAEFYNPERILTENWRDYFCAQRDDLFILPCIEGDVIMTGKRMLLNLMMTQPLIKYRRPISRDKHLMLSGIYDAGQHAKYLTEVSRSLEEYGYTREELGHDIIMTMNDAHNMCFTHLGGDICTMDIFAIAKTVTQQAVRDVCTMDYGDVTDKNINRMEQALGLQCRKVYDVLIKDDLAFNIFKAPLLCGALKVNVKAETASGQFFQFIVSAGPRSDTDDQMFLKPVIGSFLSGMTGVEDLAIESRSASKSTHYNKTQMSSTQYGNRKIHIQNSVMWHLYKGDCGSSVTMTYTPNKKTIKRYLGKYYFDVQGNMVELTKERFDDVVDKTWQFRDVQGCLHTDGYCGTCGGTLTNSFSADGNVGFLSNVNVGAIVAQLVLSTKHLSWTESAEYEIPYQLEDVLRSDTNDIYLRDFFHDKIGTMALGFPQGNLSRINDLRHASDEQNASHYSDIKYMSVGWLQEDGTVKQAATRTPMASETRTYPHLSPEILSVLRDNPKDLITQDKLVWLLLRNVEPTLPIMQCTVTNLSIKNYVKQFTDLVTKDVSRYTSMNEFMQALTDLVWERVGTHITHLSTLARSCMITSRKDFHVPIMTDPDKVMFGTLNQIIPMRSIGGLFAFQGIDKAFNKSVNFILPKKTGIFDEYLGFADTIEESMHLPAFTDRLHEETL